MDRQTADVRPRAARLFSETGVGPEARLVPLYAGGNNRIYRVESGARVYVLKEYFRHPGDNRDRLGAEIAFARFAWSSGLRCVPEAIACDAEEGLGLFGFIAGEKIPPGSLSGEDIAQAASFVISLNRFRDESQARELPYGSEACFSFSQHIDLVKRRIERLRGIRSGEPIDEAALGFVQEKLEPACGRVSREILEHLHTENIVPDAELPQEERIISPSDFGFHNALRNQDGTVCFLDFEYAGWDDPAKLTGDFFSQAAVPVPVAYVDEFLSSIAGMFAGRESILRRMYLLLPLYRVKWCCILLNDFLPVSSERRVFAQGAAGPQQKKEQLLKAEHLLGSIEYLSASRRGN